MIKGSEGAVGALRPSLPKRLLSKQECFFVLTLDATNHPIGKPKMIAMGTVNSVEVHPRDVFREAVKRNAVAVILAHNHPSGNLDPSTEDLSLTKRMVAAGDLLGIPLLDHIILGAKSYVSLADRGQL